jgi:predicted AAA+ superfamily ATPase
MDLIKYSSRLIDSHLLDWKDTPQRKPLLLRGARQVGKSSTIRHLGTKFESYFEINFESMPEEI